MVRDTSRRIPPRQMNCLPPSRQRAYYAARILLQNGLKARTVSGGMLAHSHARLMEN